MISENVKLCIRGGIRSFHENLLNFFDEVTLDTLIKKKNPYLLAALFASPVNALRESLHAVYISSYETKFGTVLENIAICMCPAGSKSPCDGIDLDLQRKGKRLLISVKSGRNWGNSSSCKKQGDDFKKSQKNHNTKRQNSGCGIHDGNRLWKTKNRATRLRRCSS